MSKIKPSKSLTKVFNFVEAFASGIELFSETTDIAKCGLDLDINFLCGGLQPFLEVFLLPMPMILCGKETVFCL